MKETENKKRGLKTLTPKQRKLLLAGGIAALVVALLLLIMFGGGVFGRLRNRLLQKPLPPAAYVASGEVRAMRLQPETAPTSEEQWRSYFEQAVAYAKQQGLNTLVFPLQQGLSVYWQSEQFPLAQTGEETTEEVDPLALLCEALQQQDIQLWVEFQPFAAGTAPDGSKAPAAELMRQREEEGQQPFAPEDKEYHSLATEALAALPLHYPVAAVVLAAENGEAESETYSTALQSMANSLHGVYRHEGYTTRLGVHFAPTASLLQTQTVRQLADGVVDTLMVDLPPAANVQNTFESLDAKAQLVAALPQSDTGLLLYTARQSEGYAGVQLGSFAALQAQPQRTGLLQNILEQKDEMPGGFEIPTKLAVNYPANNSTQTTKAHFVMGNSDPEKPLLLNGKEVPFRGAGGSFGVLLELAEGENTFVFSQQEEEYQYTLTFDPGHAPSGGGASSSGGNNADAPPTKEAPAGQVVRVSSQFASALTDYNNDGSINETLPKGASFVVAESAETNTPGQWAYRMPSGDWVLAQKCEWVDGAGSTTFTGLKAQPDDGGEWLTFTGKGAPAAYVAYEEEPNTLQLTFYDTKLQLGKGFSSELLKGLAVEHNEEENTAVLTLRLGDVWGYNLEYQDGATRLYLKRTPTRSSDVTKPLAGIRVMVDAGHGGSDPGALGLMGSTDGPHEKQLNFAQAEAIAARLRQLGAEVLLTRPGDERVSLEERVDQITQQKPDFFLSVHHNSSMLDQDLNTAKGLEAYYYHPYAMPSSKGFAQNLLDDVSGTTGRKGGSAQWSYYYVTRTTVCPAVLFEYGFLVNPAEFDDVASTTGIQAAAFGTVDALLASLPPAPKSTAAGDASAAQSAPAQRTPLPTATAPYRKGIRTNG